MKLIVGLGNPGLTYSGTRHNAGRDLVDFIAKKANLSFKSPRGLGAAVASGSVEGREIAVATLKCFMNVSGETVALLVEHFQIDPTCDLLIVVDEAALPFGKLRLRAHGSNGGHNGLKSVESCLGTSDYARLRLGIGQDLPGDLEVFVLQRFSAQEKDALPEFFERGFEACRLWTTLPVEKAMNLVNA